MTDAFSALFPPAFIPLALAHFVALLSPGQDFFLIVGHAVRQRLRGAAYICVGIAFGNAVYILLAVAGWAGLKQFPLLYRAIEFTGACYLLRMGYCLLKSSRSSGKIRPDGEEALSFGRRDQFRKGLLSALLNPKNAIFYLTLMTGILGQAATLPQQAAAGVWMVSVVLLWDLGLAAGISATPVQKLLKARIPLIEGVAGIVLGALAFGIFSRFV